MSYCLLPSIGTTSLLSETPHIIGSFSHCPVTTAVSLRAQFPSIGSAYDLIADAGLYPQTVHPQAHRLGVALVHHPYHFIAYNRFDGIGRVTIGILSLHLFAILLAAKVLFGSYGNFSHISTFGGPSYY